MSVTKRFIAGAVCPRCAAMDRIVMYATEEGQFRECVSCGFHQELKQEAAPADELQTRVNRARPAAESNTQPLRFYRKPPKH